jgi:hypothetical protein
MATNERRDGVAKVKELRTLRAEPLVSVMIVNYNYANFLGEAVESVLGQTYQNFEIVICDDGSTDDSRAVIEGYARRDPRVRHVFKENGGVASALNTAYAHTRGEVIAMLDADDLFTKEKLGRVVEAFSADRRVGMVVNPLTKFDSEGNTIGQIPQFGRLDSGELRERILKGAGHWSIAPTSGISMRRDCADLVFPIPEQEFRTEADGYMLTQAPLFYAVKAVEEPLSLYRVHSNNLTASTTVDLKWVRKVISSGERTFAALSATAGRYGWRPAKLEQNPTYCEMLLIRDYLEGASLGTSVRNYARLRRAALQVETADRGKIIAKAAVIGLASMLPRAAGVKLLEAVYLPNNLKRLTSRVARAVA